MSKFFKDNKIAQIFMANAICSLCKIYNCLLHQIAREIMSLLVNSVHEKTLQKVKTDKILKGCKCYL